MYTGLMIGSEYVCLHEDEPMMRLGGLYVAGYGICFANQSSILKRNLPQTGV